MNIARVTTISGALLAFMTLAQCIDGDMALFDDKVESATEFRSGEAIAPDPNLVPTTPGLDAVSGDYATPVTYKEI